MNKHTALFDMLVITPRGQNQGTKRNEVGESAVSSYPPPHLYAEARHSWGTHIRISYSAQLQQNINVSGRGDLSIALPPQSEDSGNDPWESPTGGRVKLDPEWGKTGLALRVA